jgi:hypothetical protein
MIHSAIAIDNHPLSAYQDDGANTLKCLSLHEEKLVSNFLSTSKLISPIALSAFSALFLKKHNLNFSDDHLLENASNKVNTQIIPINRTESNVVNNNAIPNG